MSSFTYVRCLQEMPDGTKLSGINPERGAEGLYQTKCLLDDPWLVEIKDGRLVELRGGSLGKLTGQTEERLVKHTGSMWFYGGPNYNGLDKGEYVAHVEKGLVKFIMSPEDYHNSPEGKAENEQLEREHNARVLAWASRPPSTKPQTSYSMENLGAAMADEIIAVGNKAGICRRLLSR